MSMGRPIEFDPDKALVDAMHVFWSRGYEASSMQDILKATGLSKSSLYQTFGSKQALFDSCLELYCNDTYSKLKDLFDNSSSGREFIESVFNNITVSCGNAEGSKGCFLMNTVSEFGSRDKQLSNAMGKQIKAVEKILAEAIKRDQVANMTDKELDEKALATYLITNMSGLRTMVKAGLSEKRSRETIKNILKILD
jgi:TetR/AcrR family transcriptional repressor of nem operon